MTPLLTHWSGSLHQTFRLLPKSKMSAQLTVFLKSDGCKPDEVLAKLPYDRARSRNASRTPNSKRYRDPRQVFETVGLLWQGTDGRLHLTRLGQCTLRFLEVLNEGNAPVLGAHAAYALAGCQLRNPTGAGRRYDPCMEVFPFAFIWRAMLELDGRINSDELNCELLRTRNEDDLAEAIDNIRTAREQRNGALLRAPVVVGRAVNDRIISWIALAGFGWTLILDKTDDPGETFYRIRDDAIPILERAASMRVHHREFASTEEYVRFISDLAGLPPSPEPTGGSGRPRTARR